MKIYYASQSFYPHIGGVSTYLLNLCKEMIQRGNEVVEVHLRLSGEESFAELKGIDIHRVPKEPIKKDIMYGYSKFKEAVYTGAHYADKGFNKPAEKIEGFVEFNQVNEYFGEEIKALLERNHPDIVHIHDFQLLFTYKYVPRGTPLVFTWHIPFVENMSKNLSKFLIKHLNEYDKVVFSSQEYIKSAVKQGLKPEKAELIYPIANTTHFKPLDVDKSKVREKYSLPEQTKIILCVQRIDPKSGHKQLIKAMPLIKKEIPNAKLVFVGGESLSNKLSDERAKLKQEVMSLIKQLKLEKDIIFTGNIDYNLLPEIYNSVDLVALCSRNEGFGLAITEGMACGKPVIGTKVGGIPLQIQDGKNGFLVDVDNIRATADKAVTILKNKELANAMSKKSLEIIKEKFLIKRGVEKHLILYKKLIELKDQCHKIDFISLKDCAAIITDLDRTLTDKPPKVEFDKEDYDLKLFKELKNIKTDWILATGRNYYYAKKLSNQFKIWRCIVAENGAVIYFPKTNKTISINTYYMKKAKKIIKSLDIFGKIIGKIIVSIPDKYEKTVKERLGKLIDKVEFIRNVNEIMIVPKNVNKGSGVIMALQYLKIDSDKTVVIGDGENDIDMFLNPGYKIALANSKDKLKELANHITRFPSTNGIREIIGKLR